MSEVLCNVLNSNNKKELIYKDVSISASNPPSSGMSASINTGVTIIAAGMIASNAQGSGTDKRILGSISFSWSGSTIYISHSAEDWSHDTNMSISATVRIWYYK